MHSQTNFLSVSAVKLLRKTGKKPAGDFDKTVLTQFPSEGQAAFKQMKTEETKLDNFWGFLIIYTDKGKKKQCKRQNYHFSQDLFWISLPFTVTDLEKCYNVKLKNRCI